MNDELPAELGATLLTFLHEKAAGEWEVTDMRGLCRFIV